jgi:hypothetical protein
MIHSVEIRSIFGIYDPFCKYTIHFMKIRSILEFYVPLRIILIYHRLPPIFRSLYTGSELKEVPTFRLYAGF